MFNLDKSGKSRIYFNSLIFKFKHNILGEFKKFLGKLSSDYYELIDLTARKWT
jgi:hypothetical protein